MNKLAQAAEAGCRFALGHIIDRSLALVEYLRKKGPKAVHNMDTLLLRESMDVIGASPPFRSSCLLEQLATRVCHKGMAGMAEDCRRYLARNSCRRHLASCHELSQHSHGIVHKGASWLSHHSPRVQAVNTDQISCAQHVRYDRWHVQRPSMLQATLAARVARVL